MSLNSIRNSRLAYKTSLGYEPEGVKAWRKYANPINQALAEKWKHGAPRTKDRRVVEPPVKTENPVHTVDWQDI